MHWRINILRVEDDLMDVAAIDKALEQVGRPFLLIVVHDGESALKVLRGEQGQSPLSQPYLILLDLYLPKVDGFAFLHTLRQDPSLRNSIVFVVTGSRTDVDKRKTYQQGIAGYLPKANVGEHFHELVTFLDTYCNLVEFPEAEV